jgi:hypothetical protein
LIAFNARSGPIPLLLRAGLVPHSYTKGGTPCVGSAEPVLRSQEGSGKGGLSRFARGMGLIAFNARSGPIPLLLRAGLVPHSYSKGGTPCVGSAEPFLRSQEGSGKGRLSRFARGMGLIAFNARSGTIPLRCGFWGLRGTVPALAGRLGEGWAFALCAREGFDHLQCLLRPGSAAASCGVAQPGAVVLGATLESRVDCGCPIWDEEDAQYRCRRCIP